MACSFIFVLFLFFLFCFVLFCFCFFVLFFIWPPNFLFTIKHILDKCKVV